MKKFLPFALIFVFLISLPTFARGKADKNAVEESVETSELEENLEQTEEEAQNDLENDSNQSPEENADGDDEAKEVVETVGTADIIKGESSNSESQESEPSNKFSAIKEKPFIIYNEGVTYSQITRIIKQDKYSRSNFVWQNHLIGLSLEAQTVHIKPVDSILRLGIYYPFFYTFNGMKQPPKQPILYAFDVFWGPIFQADMWKYVYINFAFGPHFLYQLSDEYHHVEFGGGVLVGVELPLARRWTILMNGLASIDYGNFGSNRHIQPYNLVYNYQVELGVRYSRKKPHAYSYLGK